jgi:glycosyltransferase involved in cell wall biosynthesis
MLDFDGMLRRALAQAAGRRIALATPYDLPERIARDLMHDTPLACLVFNHAEEAPLEDICAGWWVDRGRGRIFLRRGAADTLLIAGVDPRQTVGPHLLLEARLKGISRIITCDWLGSTIENVEVVEALENRLGESGEVSRVGDLAFSEAFELIYNRMGDTLRLRSSDFDLAKAVICIGSLGPGGAERQAAMTAAGISRTGRMRVEVLCNFIDSPADFFRPEVEASGARVARLEHEPPELSLPVVRELHHELTETYSAIRMGDIFLEIVRYAAMLRQMKPGVLHTWMDYCNALCGTAAHLVGVPGLVMSGRSVSPSHFRIFQPYMRPAYHAILNRKQAIFLNNSRAGASDYASWLGLPREAISVIHNGFDFPDVDRPSARAAIRKLFAIGETQKVVGSVLRFSEEKQPALLIDMASELSRRDPDLRFIFCGGGVMHEEMRAIVKSRGLETAIHLPGVVDGTWRYLAAMDVFTLTSRMEGLPNVLIEAQSVGLPVICTGAGGMGETFVHGETGLAVKDASPERLADAVSEILLNEGRLRNMSERAYQHARREFSADQLVGQTLAAYQSSANRR